MKPEDLFIPTLGEAAIDSPVMALLAGFECPRTALAEHRRVLFEPLFEEKSPGPETACLELAGPRSKIHFKPGETTAAIVTCGGLCPGINDVIRGIVMTLYYRYGVHAIWGVPFGYQGLVERFGHEWIRLEPSTVSTIHRFGGTMLASSRGYQEAAEMLKLLVRRRVDVLFVIGGDGTIRGALQVAQEAAKQGVRLSVIGVPKTIDNDILHIDQSFGFETAFSEAVESISCAHTEALGAPNGIGLVKLMGRHSGFIACYAALARNDANFVLIPECPFELDGEHGLLAALKARLARRGHAVILAAEGAGQDLMEGGPLGRDASGNVKLKDIGPFLKERILDYFEKQGTEVNLKYIDPSYIIRSVPASPQDSVYCLRLADSAVHAAMSGRTEMVVGRRHGYYVHLPMKLIAAGRRRVDPSGDLWMSVLEATGQPASMKSRAGAK